MFVKVCLNPFMDWSSATSNNILMHATLYTSSKHQVVSGISHMLDITFYHRGQLIKLINEMLDDHTRSACDAVIGGIINLAIWQVRALQFFCGFEYMPFL
jgi:hypothetical protein